MKYKVVIIGHGYTSRLGIIRSLAKIDCEITVIAMVFHGWLGRMVRLSGGRPIDCYSKYVNHYYYCIEKDEKGLIQLLLDKCLSPGQKVVIIPDSDFSAAAIDRNQEVLKPYFVFPQINNKPGAIEHWMSKTVQKDLAREVGLTVAEGRVLSVKDGKYVVPDIIKYPCFTKPLATISGGKGFLRRCDNAAELQKVMRMVGEKFCNTEVLVEDYKIIDKEYAVVGFSDGKNVVISGVIEFIANSKSHFGIAREGMVKPINGFETIIDQFRDFVSTIGFCGLFDIDFYESGGKMYYSEMNFRFGGSGYVYTVMGANLPAMMVRFLCGEEYQDMLHDVSCVATYVNERMCLDDYLHGYLNKKQVKAIISRPDICFIMDSDDIAPFKRMKRELRILGLKKFRLKIKKLAK
ncbi:MAG: hypothetical protein IKX60_06950 [Bacteroidales bacterium]|nr:hypothetical protein [Bacteroidales bacterium]